MGIAHRVNGKNIVASLRGKHAMGRLDLKQDVRYWPLADIGIAHVRFQL
jgi:hypothetical protein